MISFLKRCPRSFLVICLGVLVNRLGCFVLPFLTLYLTTIHHYSIEYATSILTCIGLGSCFSGPVGGYFADNVGRKKTLIISFLFSSVAMLGLGTFYEMYYFPVMAFFFGIVSELYRPGLNAIIVDVVDPKDRTHAFNFMYWLVNLGFSFSMTFASLVALSHFKLLVFFDAASTFLFGVLIYFFVPESGKLSEKHEEKKSLRVAFADKQFMLFVASMFSLSLVFCQVSSTYSLDMQQKGLSSFYGLLIGFNSFLVLILQPFISSWFKKTPSYLVLILGAIFLGIGFGMNSFVTTLPLYVVSVFLWTFGEILFIPIAPKIISDVAPDSVRAIYQGVYQMNWGASSCLAPFFGGLILSRFGGGVLWTGCFGLCLLSALGHFKFTRKICINRNYADRL